MASKTQITTNQPTDEKGTRLEASRYKYLTANGTTTLQATGTDVIVKRVVIFDDDDGATWALQNGAGTAISAGICDHVGGWTLNIGFDSDGNPIDGLKIVIASVTGTLKLMVCWQ